VLAESADQAHLVEALHAVSVRLGGLPKRWRFDRMATVCHPASGRLTASFAAVAKHYEVHVDICPSRHGNRKGSVEKSNHSAAQRWWRTLPDDMSIAQAQASLDAFCVRVGDARPRQRDGLRTSVGALAGTEPLSLLPPPFPATVTVERIVSSQALVAFRGNRYSVPPGLAGSTVIVSHRLGEQTVDISTVSRGATAGTVLARHRREPDGAGVLVRDTVHVTALETAVLAAFDSSKPCARKVRRPVSPAALAEAEHLRGQHDGEREVVVDLARYAQAARDRQQAAQ
jgi:hypothetical protein